MNVLTTALADALVFVPTPHTDERGFFSRTYDAAVGRRHGLPPERFVQDSQSRSGFGVLRGLHGRSGDGEGKLVRCARGAVHDVIVDARPDAATFGQWTSFRLDDVSMRQLYVPPGFLHGFQVLTEVADVCYRIDREHDPSENISVRFDDPDLAVSWPAPVTLMSDNDRVAGSWADLVAVLGAGESPASGVSGASDR